MGFFVGTEKKKHGAIFVVGGRWNSEQTTWGVTKRGGFIRRSKSLINKKGGLARKGTF